VTRGVRFYDDHSGEGLANDLFRTAWVTRAGIEAGVHF
jgi:hypothetical protein